MEAYLILGLIFLLFIGLIINKVRPELLFVLAVSVCLFSGWIGAGELLGKYSNETLIGLILLLQVSTVLERTHLLPLFSRVIIQKGSFASTMIRLTGITALLSSVLNNTAVVAAFMGIVRQNRHFAPSKLLIPLSYAAIVGGVITLVGTSTNLIVNSFVVEAGLPSLGLFDFVWVGLPLAAIIILYLVIAGPWLLPKQEAEESRHQGDFFLEADVRDGSKLIGKSVASNGLRRMDYLFLAEIVRGGRLISPVTPEEIIHQGDSLVFTGDISQMQELLKYDGLELHSGIHGILRSNLQEVVVRHNAPIIGQQVKEAQFRTKFDAVIVAVRRGDNQLPGKIGELILQPGDNLVLAVGNEFEKHENIRRNFIFLSEVELEDLLPPRQGWLALAIFLGAIGISAAGWLPLFKSMLLALFAMLALGHVRIKHLKNSLNLGLLLMIGSSLGLAEVMATFGADKVISEAILAITGTASPHLALTGLFFATLLVTELITNNAAAALMFPIAMATSEALGLSYLPFVMAVAYGASASFLTPVGYQTNMMVFTLGKYRFTDFIKTGLGVSILYSLVVIWLLPKVFPF